MLSRALLGRYAPSQFSRCSVHNFSNPISRTSSRFFSRANQLLAPKKKPAPTLLKTPTSTKTTKPQKPPVRPLPLREPPSGDRLARFRNFVSEKKDATTSSVVLYIAPSHKGYILGAYSVAAFCYAYAGFNFYTISADPNVSAGKLEMGLFGGICIVMAAMGTVFLLRGSNLVSSVVAHQSKGNTLLEIKVRRMVPFLKQRIYSISPSQLSCSRKVVVPPRNPNQTAQDVQKKVESQKAVDQMSFFRAPFKKISYSLWRVFMNSRRLFSQEHFVHLQIDGKRGTFRMDTTGQVSEGFFLLNSMVREGY